MTTAAIYARYSSDLQRDASIEDQIRLCKERAKREGWRVVNCYTDHAISGASLIRPGMKMLLQDGQAGIGPRIFNDYAAGKAPQAIAKQLNKEAVPGPSGTDWGPSTIHGNPDRGTGILNNELYVGKLVWNRLRYIKDPETGKRVSRP